MISRAKLTAKKKKKRKLIPFEIGLILNLETITNTVCFFYFVISRFII